MATMTELDPRAAPSGTEEADRLRRKAKRRRRRRGDLTGWAFVGPSTLLVVGLSIFPAVWAFFISRTKWDLIRPAKDVGWKNYQLLIKDPEVWGAIQHTMFFTARDAIDIVRLFCGPGTNVPVGRRAAVAEALARINMRLWIGNFELDFADGEVRFRVSMDVEQGLLSEKMVDNMMRCAFSTMERFHDAIMKVALGNVLAADAVGEVP